jgi:hypothetical protein
VHTDGLFKLKQLAAPSYAPQTLADPYRPKVRDRPAGFVACAIFIEGNPTDRNEKGVRLAVV